MRGFAICGLVLLTSAACSDTSTKPSAPHPPTGEVPGAATSTVQQTFSPVQNPLPVSTPTAGASSTTLPSPAPQGFSFSSRPLTQNEQSAMTGVTWRPGCPIALQDLRHLSITYWDFEGKTRTGALVVHHDTESATRAAFARLYELRFPIRRMEPIEAYRGSDFDSIEADNTSAFNCRKSTTSTRWSQHAYGRAIDVNPIENPYISGGSTSHRASNPYLDRSKPRPGMLLPGAPATRAFTDNGWVWGGTWKEPIDLQHFSRNGQ